MQLPKSRRRSTDIVRPMGTLSSELGPHVPRLVEEPRVYADANMPSGVVEYMRITLGWDVLFVLEHDDLRRATDCEHFRLARQLGRTLVTQDRDYNDDRRFPLAESGGVIVVSAPDERASACVSLEDTPSAVKLTLPPFGVPAVPAVSVRFSCESTR